MKGILISSLLLGLAVPAFVSAEVRFTEIMYDLPGTDTDREWVEIFNSGSEPVTITSDFRFVTNGTNHTLTTKDNPIELPAGSYAVLVDDPVGFSADWPGTNGLVIDSSFSLHNTAGTLEMKDGDSNVLASVSYTSDQGGAGDGNSLQLSGSSWIAAQPTPLAENASEPSIPPNDEDDDTSTTTAEQDDDDDDTGGNTGSSGGSSGGGSSTSGSTHSSSVADKNSTITYVFTVAAGRKRHTAAGSEVVFDATPKLKSGDKGGRINYRWSFGDGYIATGKRVAHTYSFPGDYVVVLNAKQGDEEAVSRTEVKVDKPQLDIVRVDQVTGLIELENKASSEINLGSWRVRVGEKNFVFPTDTILKSKSNLSLSSVLTGFSPVDFINPVLVVAQDGQVVAQKNAFELVAQLTPEIVSDPVVIEAVEEIPQADTVVGSGEIIEIPTEVATTSMLEVAAPIIIEKSPGVLSKTSNSIKNLFREVFR